MIPAVRSFVALVSVLLVMFLVAVPVTPTFAQPFSFRLMVPDVPYVDYGDASFGDIDGDGLLDLLVMGNQRADPPFAISMYQATAGAVFTDEFSGVWQMPFEVTNLQTALWHGALDWRDFDGDGDLDAVATGASTASDPYVGSTVVLVNDGNGHLVESTALEAPGLYGSTARWGDYDGDGDADLLLIGAESPSSFRTVLLDYSADPAGVGSLTEVATTLPNIAYGDVAWADFDNDGDQDVLLAGARADGTFVADVFVNVDGEFTPLNAPLPSVAFASADWGDFDGDGDLDIVISGGVLGDELFDGLTHVYRNDGGTGSAFTLAHTLPRSFHGDVSWADYDNDGWSDLLVSGSDGATGDRSVRVFNNEDETFVERVFLTGVSFASSTWADFDADLDADVVVTGLDQQREPVLNVYRNEQRMPNTAPSTPSGLTSESAAGVATLSWSPSTDEQSGTGSITYNVRVGTAPGLSDVVSSNTASGGSARLFSARGNVDQATTVSFALPQGEYYWSVQAIDASFAASSFAPETVVNVLGKGGQTSSEDPTTEAVFALSEPYPNPSSGSVTFEYSIPDDFQGGGVTITVFDVLGAVVARTSPNARRGTNVWRWDARSSRGARLASGLYFVQLRAATDVATQRVLLLDQ